MLLYFLWLVCFGTIWQIGFTKFSLQAKYMRDKQFDALIFTHRWMVIVWKIDDVSLVHFICRLLKNHLDGIETEAVES